MITVSICIVTCDDDVHTLGQTIKSLEKHLPKTWICEVLVGFSRRAKSFSILSEFIPHTELTIKTYDLGDDNPGPYFGRKYLSEKAQYDYIWFLDSDDILIADIDEKCLDDGYSLVGFIPEQRLNMKDFRISSQKEMNPYLYLTECVFYWNTSLWQWFIKRQVVVAAYSKLPSPEIYNSIVAEDIMVLFMCLKVSHLDFYVHYIKLFDYKPSNSSIAPQPKAYANAIRDNLMYSAQQSTYWINRLFGVNIEFGPYIFKKLIGSINTREELIDFIKRFHLGLKLNENHTECYQINNSASVDLSSISDNCYLKNKDGGYRKVSKQEYIQYLLKEQQPKHSEDIEKPIFGNTDYRAESIHSDKPAIEFIRNPRWKD